MIPSYAVVPSYGRECLLKCLDSLVDQVDLLFLVQTSEFAVRAHPKLICLPWDSSRELNISEWWNLGIKAAAMTAGGRPEWDVLVVNDDVIAPPGLVAGLSSGLRVGTSALAYLPGQAPGRVTPITGWCFMIRGETGILADPQFRWWCGDDDIYLQARAKGGVRPVEGCGVAHLYPCGHDYLMRERIPLDIELFRKKWSI